MQVRYTVERFRAGDRPMAAAVPAVAALPAGSGRRVSVRAATAASIPYDQNVLKGDLPVIGDDIFVDPDRDRRDAIRVPRGADAIGRQHRGREARRSSSARVEQYARAAERHLLVRDVPAAARRSGRATGRSASRRSSI